MAPFSLCSVFKSLCKKNGVLGLKSPPGKELEWRWLRWWAETLDDADVLPSLRQLEVLANACLNAGYHENALEIATMLLNDTGEFAGQIDPLTKANLQLIGMRAAVALGKPGTAKRLLRAMPPQKMLMEAITPAAAA